MKNSDDKSSFNGMSNSEKDVLARRSFLKRSGGATAASFLSWQSLSSAQGGEGGGEDSGVSVDESCSRNLTWSGARWICYDFYQLREEIESEIKADLQSDIQLAIAHLHRLIQLHKTGADITYQFQPEPVRWIRDKFYAWGEEKLLEFLNLVTSDFLEASIKKLLTELPSDNYLFKGYATQFNTHLVAPVLDGPDIIRAPGGPVTIDLEIQGMGFKLSFDLTAKMEEVVRSVGFNFPTGPKVLDVECFDSGPETVTSQVKPQATATVSATVLFWNLSGSGESDGLLTPRIPVKPGALRTPAKPFSTPPACKDLETRKAEEKKYEELLEELQNFGQILR